SLLLYAIRRFSGGHMGAYKHLLTMFTLSDSFLVILQIFRVTLAGYTHGVATDCFLDHRGVSSFFIACESVPFSLLVLHFLYRYWSVRRPHLIKYFSSKPFILSLVIGIVGVIISW
ncbi:hypothetical protein PENTCL1PPCAC_29652, partial [Pristionchus entomophagus]